FEPSSKIGRTRCRDDSASHGCFSGRNGAEEECYLNTSCLAPESPSSMNLDDVRFLQNLGFNIRERRVAQGYTQAQLAQKCNLHRTFIGSVERGERNVSVLNLRLIARILRVPLAELFGKPARQGRP